MQHLIHTYTSVYSIGSDANLLYVSVLGGGSGSRLGDCSHRQMSLAAMLKKDNRSQSPTVTRHAYNNRSLLWASNLRMPIAGFSRVYTLLINIITNN